jgi:hypothetical protein
MKTETQKIETLEEILNSLEFNELFNMEAEEKEIKASGWNYKELNSFGKQLAKKIK